MSLLPDTVPSLMPFILADKLQPKTMCGFYRDSDRSKTVRATNIWSRGLPLSMLPGCSQCWCVGYLPAYISERTESRHLTPSGKARSKARAP